MASINEKPEGVATASAEEGRAEAPETKAGEDLPARSVQTPQRSRRTQAKPKEEKKAWVYIGPTIPRTTLIENTVARGTRSAVEEHFKPALEKYPAVKRLIITIEELPDAREKVRAAGNILSKSYADIASAIKQKEAK